MNYLTSLVATVVLCAPPAPDAFLAGVRPTEPLTPAEQQTTFHLPPGFQIELFAAEPDIQKPMNMAFDARGRLWVTGSVEYPYAAKTERGADCVRVLEDTDHDGRADKISTFADGLNIPIGLYPYRDGAIVYSIPNIWFLRDTDGDGLADQREVLYGALGNPRDTHGMQNAFRRGFDGWLYVNHGFANETTITGRNGSSIRLQSGNTYRLRVDGSQVEQYTWGQVNPFGSTFLPNGDLITADCHSKPLTLLLRGAYYSSFGKPHDGLGFAPDLMTHDHGSTAICGVVHLTGDHFPMEYRGRLLVGNVMTSRVNQDLLRYHGATAEAIEQPDFVRCDDPWFRPVDIQLGPDGALYVADFYNRIIGHYEVPLEHPGRDKHRARIWRITYRPDGKERAHSPEPQLATANQEQLIAALGHSNLTVRMLASDQLCDRIGASAIPALTAAASQAPTAVARTHALWALYRLASTVDESVLVGATQDADELVRLHAFRVLSETSRWPTSLTDAVKRGLLDQSALVRRAAADAAGRSHQQLVPELLQALPADDKTDPALRHTIRMAIREQLREPAHWTTVRFDQLPGSLRPLVAEIALGVPTAESAQFLLDSLHSDLVDRSRLEAQVIHATLHLPIEQLPDLVSAAKELLHDDVDLQAKLALTLHQRLAQRGIESRPLLESWGHSLAEQLLATATGQQPQWLNVQGDGPWGFEERQCADGQVHRFLSSLPGGEQKTGVLRSRTFVIPPRLTFYLCGHLGFPTNPPVEKNYVQLRKAESGEVLAKALPPRNDRATQIEWDLARHAGSQGYLEVVDGITESGYAWLAVARFEPPVVEVPTVAPGSMADRQIAAAQLVSALGLPGFETSLGRLVADREADWRARKAAALTLIDPATRPALGAALSVLTEPVVAAPWREQVLQLALKPSAELPAVQVSPDQAVLEQILKSLPSREQKLVADSLAGTPAGGEILLQLLKQGIAGHGLLRDPTLTQKLSALHLPRAGERVRELVAALPPANLELQKLIDTATRTFRIGSTTNSARGEELFRKHCAVCHQVRGQGALVGPQLDGIGNRGLERVLEDVLDPNRNVDANFHVTILTLANGRVVTGLVRREEGTQLILADQQGKEFSVSKDEIEERAVTRNSLMPANVGELMKPDEFIDLVSFLVTLRAPIE